MAIQIACPECDAKLKAAKAPDPGRKIKCPRCQHVFEYQASAPPAVPKAKPKPASRQPAAPTRAPQASRKKKPAPADDPWDDDFDDYEDDYDDDHDDYAPPRRSRGAGAAKRRAPSKSSGSTATMVGLTLLAIALIGGIGFGIYKMTSGGDGLAGGSRADNFADLTFLPPQTEAVARIKVDQIRKSAVAEMVMAKLPQAKEAFAGGEFQNSSFKPEDIDDVIFGVWDMQSMPGAMPGAMPGMGGGGTPQKVIIIVNLTRELNSLEATGKDPIEYKGQTLYRDVGDAQLAGTNTAGWVGWLPARNKIVMGPEAIVKAAIDQGPDEVQFDQFSAAKDMGSSSFVLAFAPKGGLTELAANGPPQAAAMLEGATAACIGVDFSADIGLQAKLVCGDSGKANQILGMANLGIGALKEQVANAPGPMSLILNPVKSMVDRIRVEASGNELILTADAKSDELGALLTTAGPFLQGAMGAGQPGGGFGPGSGPPGGFGPPGN